MAPGASSTNDAFREFYAPRTLEPSKTYQKPSMPRVEHQTAERPIELRTLHGSTHRTKSGDVDQIEAGCWGEIKNHKAGDEFLLLWKWVDDFMDKRRAKNNSSKNHNIKRSTSRQTKPTPSSSPDALQVPRPAVTLSQEALRRQATDREDMREYNAQRHTLWGELVYLYQTWRAQQAKKKADQIRQRGREETARNQATECRDEPTRGRSTNRGEPPQTTPSPRNQDHAADPHLGIARKPVPVYNKKRGEVQKHTVRIAQLPPVHNSVHLQHTPSNNYRTKPSTARGQKDKSTRDTRFSDFLHQERNALPLGKPATSRDTQWTYAVSGEDDELARNSRFSSILDPAKAIKKAREAEKAKPLKCYCCGTSNCPGVYRDKISGLWVCLTCQRREKIGNVQCVVCGQPNSPDTRYADNRLWMCSSCRDPTTLKELPPSPKFSRKATPKLKVSQPPIPQGVDKTKSEDIKHFIPSNRRHSHASLASQGFSISEYNSEHLYSDDSYETRATSPPPQRPIGLGVTFRESEEDKEEYRPTPPLKDSKYHQEPPDLPAMNYSQSHLHRPGTNHPYAPSPGPATTKASVYFAQDMPKAKPSSKPSEEQLRQQTESFNPTAYPYTSPPRPPTQLHKPRPASSVYPTDEPASDFPYPPPSIPREFVARSKRSGTMSRAESSPLSTESGRAGFNRRSSWYDFWKPVFEKTGEEAP